MECEKKFDSESIVAEQLADKKIIFLDLMMWNKFYDNKETEIINIKQEIERLLGEHKIICPASFTVILESAQRQDETKRKGIIDIMKRYSNMVFFARPDIIFENEYSLILYNELSGNTEPNKNSDMFAYGIEAFGGPFSIKLPNMENISKQNIIDATEEFLSTIVQAAPEFFSQIITDENLKKELDEIAEKVSTDKKKLAEIEEEEFQAVTRFYLPNIQNAIKSSLARLAMDKKRPDEKFLSADKRKMIMKSKYFESCIKLDTRLRISYPNITSHDYFDSWHIANSLGFVDYVVVDAKWAEIIKQTKLDSKYSIKVFSAKPNSLKEFFKELKSL